ncbi:hypothetical protein ACOSQ4_007011 [Xanthoceras sorbifolium]
MDRLPRRSLRWRLKSSNSAEVVVSESACKVLINHNVARVENELEGQGLTVDGEQSCIVADMEGSHFSGEESAVGQNGNSISGKDSVISRFSPKKTCGRKWKRAARNVPNQSALEGIPSPI